jgi:hypothetical protein
MDIDEVVLQPKHMLAARELIVSKYPWLQHITTMDAIPSIRREGIRTHRDRGALPHIRNAWGSDAEYIICLHPVGCKVRELCGTKDPPFAKLAIESSVLPDRLTSDWTIGYTFHDKWQNLLPSISPSENILRAVEDLGSLVIYQAIPRDVVRVRCKTGSDDRATWPLLADVVDSDIQQFKSADEPIED